MHALESPRSSPSSSALQHGLQILILNLPGILQLHIKLFKERKAHARTFSLRVQGVLRGGLARQNKGQGGSSDGSSCTHSVAQQCSLPHSAAQGFWHWQHHQPSDLRGLWHQRRAQGISFFFFAHLFCARSFWCVWLSEPQPSGYGRVVHHWCSQVRDVKEPYVHRVAQYIQDHFIVGDPLKRQLRQNILRLMDIKCYRGSRSVFLCSVLS